MQARLVLHGQQNNGYGPHHRPDRSMIRCWSTDEYAGGYEQVVQPQQPYAQPLQGYGQPQQFQQAPPPPPQAYGVQPGYAPQHPTSKTY
eukprot:scaffold126343_cov57-Attheya_sp.AAC.1